MHFLSSEREPKVNLEGAEDEFGIIDIIILDDDDDDAIAVEAAVLVVTGIT